MHPERAVTRDELRALLGGVTTETVSNWIKDGRIPKPDVQLSRRTLHWNASTLDAVGIVVPGFSDVDDESLPDEASTLPELPPISNDDLLRLLKDLLAAGPPGPGPGVYLLFDACGECISTSGSRSSFSNGWAPTPTSNSRRQR